MNLHDISKLPPAMQRAAMADQARATAARERIMAQVSLAGAPVREKVYLPAPPAKSPQKAINAAAQAILPQVPGLKVKQPHASESLMQQAVVRWFDIHACEWNLEPELLMAFPLQGKRTKKSGRRLKSEGMRKGTLDMQLCVPRGDCCSLWIENKSPRGVLTLEQKLMLKRLASAGAATVVCRSADEAIAAITAYLNLPTPSKP